MRSRALIRYFVVGVLFGEALWAQASLRSVERRYYKGEYLALAEESVDPDQAPPKQLLYYASAYYRLGERERAYQAYQKAFAKISPTEVEPHFLAEYGRLCLEYENPTLALQLFNEALQRTTSPDSQNLLSRYIAYANQLKSYQEPPPQGYRWVAYNLGAFNTPAHEYSLFIHKGRLYFISRRDPERGQDPEDLLPHEALYWAKVGDSTVKPVGFFSSKHEGIAGFVGDTLIVYRSARRRGDFYIAYPSGDAWTQPVKWKAFPNSRKGSEDALCEDPKTGEIIFSSDRKGTLGGKDLWVTRRLPSGKFAPPENLSVLNSPYNEDAPFIVGDTLYFAHDGPGSLGGYDLYRSVRQPGGGWSKPERLPKPFNSPAHDSYLFYQNPDSVYLSSSRVGGKGRVDLYLMVRQPLPPPPPEGPAPAPRVYSLRIRTYDARTGQPVQAYARLRPPEGEVLSGRTSAAGELTQPKPPAGTYLLEVWADGYATALTPVTIPDAGDAQEEVAMLSAEELKKLRLPRLHFNFDKYDLRAEAPAALDTVLRILQQYPTLVIEVAGHTDSIGTQRYNQGLSERRANTVYNYLIERGVSPARLKPRGYSEDRPLVPNDTPYRRFLNRRVEFVPLVGRPPEME
ncbi:MAG: hypothetical protein KatS3mg026_0253 [Bacteroidia bacterium]|nr:MAG: hypothetical protein KatS3mg026_0253 [Bacteroidia bacterium]